MGREDGYETPQKVCTGILDKVTKKITSLLTDCGEGAACPVYQRWLEDSAAAKAKKQLANKFEAAARKNSQQTKTLSMAEAMAQLDAKLKKDRKNKYGQPCRRRLPQDSTDEFLKKMNASIAADAARTKKANAEAKILRDAAESYSQNVLAGFRDIIAAGNLLKNPDATGLSAAEKAKAYAILNDANNRRRLYSASHNPV